MLEISTANQYREMVFSFFIACFSELFSCCSVAAEFFGCGSDWRWPFLGASRGYGRVRSVICPCWQRGECGLRLGLNTDSTRTEHGCRANLPRAWYEAGGDGRAVGGFRRPLSAAGALSTRRNPSLP